MATYSMAQVETLTGISAHTLRIWERRYSFLNPERTETNIRYYGEEELKTLLNIGILIRNGHRISKVDKMSNEEIHQLVTEILSNALEENEDEINALTLSMLEMDEDEFTRIFQRRVNRKGLTSAITELIYPFLGHVGVLWGTNKAIPAQEHFITNLIRQKIISAIDNLPQPADNAPRIVMYLLEGEDHEIGLLLASYIARDLGWKVYYLGQNVPAANICDVTEIAKPQAMLAMFVVPSPDRTVKFIEMITDQIDVPFLISGNRENFSDVDKSGQVIYMKSPDEFVAYLEEHSGALA